MWARHSHMLAPLTKITPSKVRFKWTKIGQDTFDEIKPIVARNTLLAYTGFNGEIKIHTNASNIQLGAVISQKIKPVDFYGRKLDDA